MMVYDWIVPPLQSYDHDPPLPTSNDDHPSDDDKKLISTQATSTLIARDLVLLDKLLVKDEQKYGSSDFDKFQTLFPHFIDSKKKKRKRGFFLFLDFEKLKIEHDWLFV